MPFIIVTVAVAAPLIMAMQKRDALAFAIGLVASVHLLTIMGHSALQVIGNYARFPAWLLLLGLSLRIPFPSQASGANSSYRVFRTSVFFLTLWGLVSMIWTVNLRDTLVKGLIFILMFWCYSVLKARRWDLNTDLLRADVATAVFVGLTILAAAVSPILIGPTQDMFLGGRFMGTFQNPNTLGSIGLATFFPAIWVSLGQSRWKRLAAGVLPLLAVFLSGSRGVIVSLAFGALVSLFLATFRSPNVLRVAATTLLMSAFIFRQHVLTFVSELPVIGLVPGFARLFGGGLQDNARITAWESATTIFLDSPILGHGWNATRSVLASYNRAGWAASEVSQAHNSYIEIGVDLGVIGIALFLGALSALIARILTARAIPWEIQAFVTTGLAYGLTESVLFGLSSFVAVLWWWMAFAVFVTGFDGRTRKFFHEKTLLWGRRWGGRELLDSEKWILNDN